VRYCTGYALEHCAEDLHYFEHEYPQGEKGLQSRLRRRLLLVVPNSSSIHSGVTTSALSMNAILPRRLN
jgi:hypothetical protein